MYLVFCNLFFFFFNLTSNYWGEMLYFSFNQTLWGKKILVIKYSSATLSCLMPNITLPRDIYLTIPPLLYILKVSKFLLLFEKWLTILAVKCLCRSKIFPSDKFLGVEFSVSKRKNIIKAFGVFNGFLL